MSTLASLQLFVLAALLFAAIASMAASAALPLMRGRLQQLPPAARFRRLWLLAAAPLIVPVAGMAAALAPSLLGLVWPSYDHCLAHGGTHAHLCFEHLPERAGGPVSWLVLFGALGFLGGRAARGIAGMVRAGRVCARLLAHGIQEPRLAASVVPSPSPICVSLGIIRPKTLVSEGFLRAIAAEQLEAVMLHEREHGRRRDALSLAVARATSVLIWPGARKRLLFELALAAEQSCDEAAAGALGDRLTMAEAILKVERLVGVPRELAPLAVSIGGTAVPLRIAALVAPPLADRGRPVLAIVILVLLLAASAVSGELHHLVETAVGVLAH